MINPCLHARSTGLGGASSNSKSQVIGPLINNYGTLFDGTEWSNRWQPDEAAVPETRESSGLSKNISDAHKRRNQRIKLSAVGILLFITAFAVLSINISATSDG